MQVELKEIPQKGVKKNLVSGVETETNIVNLTGEEITYVDINRETFSIPPVPTTYVRFHGKREMTYVEGVPVQRVCVQDTSNLPVENDSTIYVLPSQGISIAPVDYQRKDLFVVNMYTQSLVQTASGRYVSSFVLTSLNTVP